MIILKNVSIITAAFAVLYSVNPLTENTSHNTIGKRVTSLALESKQNVQTVGKKEYPKTPTTVIKFNEFSLSLKNFSSDGETSKTIRVKNDTVSISTEIGETIEGKLISIVSNQLTNVTIEQRYETSVVIANEGPHCDLVNWEHYTSDWKQLKRSKNAFMTNKYTEADGQKFPEVQIDDLKKKVREQCGEEWFKLVENIKKPTELPSAVEISRHFLRIKGKRKDNGKTVTKLITIKQPMGC